MVWTRTRGLVVGVVVGIVALVAVLAWPHHHANSPAYVQGQQAAQPGWTLQNCLTAQLQAFPGPATSAWQSQQSEDFLAGCRDSLPG